MADRRESAPRGVVTLLATDVVSSTRIWSDARGAGAAMARQRELIVDAVHRHGGYVPPDQGEGDSTLSAFQLPIQALFAALDAQRALAAADWPERATVRVRMGVHTGDAELLPDGNYGGLAVIRCVRLRSLGHGGQVLASGATAETVADALDNGMRLVELGTVALDGLERPERVHQLSHPELEPPMERLVRRAAPTIPRWSTPLVGREREIADVVQRVRESRLVTISGVGGSGKTRLASAVAERVGAEFEDGVAWVELARLSSSDQVAGAVAAACGVVPSSGAPTLDQLVEGLSSGSRLVVLDNCEHVIEACAQLVEALLSRSGPGLRLLTTTRESIAVTGETVWRILSLAVPPESERDAQRIADHDAVRLFLERGRAVRPDLSTGAEALRRIADICRRLDGMPLAIELAAARLGALSIERLAEGLDERFRLLTGGSRRSVERQRTLLASVEWSHDLLEPQEKRLFRRLSVFVSPFTLESAEAVAAGDDVDRFEVFELLARLVGKSLVRHLGDRYQLLETLRQYGLERARDEGELNELRDRHLAAFRQRAVDWQLDARIVTEDLLEELMAESPDLLAALDWSMAGGDLAVDLLRPLNELWALTTRIDEAREVLPKVFEALETDPARFVEGVAACGQALFLAGLVEPLRRAVAWVSEDTPREVRARLDFASLIVAGGSQSRHFTLFAEEKARQSIEVFRAAGIRSEVIGATMNMALAQSQTGKLVEARRTLAWLDQHVPANAARRHHDMARLLVSNLSGSFRESRRIFEGLGSARVHATGLGGQAGILGLWTRDSALVAHAVRLRERGAFAGAFAGFAHLTDGAAALIDDDLEGACVAFREGASKPAIGAQLSCDLFAAELALSLGRLSEAEAAVEGAIEGLRGAEPPFQKAWIHRVRADMAASGDNPKLARRLAHDALDLALEHDIALIETDALECLAVLAAQEGQWETSARLLGACEAFREWGGYRWRPPHRQRALDRIAKDLSRATAWDGDPLSLGEAAEYARRGRGARGRPAHGWESLTPAEERVIELVAEGLSNKDIAGRLFVSLATVKSHLVHVYRKLEVRSRAELAAQASLRRNG